MSKKNNSNRRNSGRQRDPLNEPLLSFSKHDHWTLKDSFEGTLIIGTNGSGKTSGPGRTIAHQFLNYGLGGLVLTAKPDECDLFKSYCKETGRLDDLIIMEPGGEFRFNFIDYVGRTQVGPGTGLAANVADVIYQIAGESGQATLQQDSFWEGEQTKVLLNPIETLLLTGAELTPKALYDIVITAPSSQEELKSQEWQDNSSCFQALKTIRQMIREGKLSEEEIEDYRLVETYWLYEYSRLEGKTKGIVQSMFTTFFTEFNRRPNRKLFCSDSTITPEACFDGKIIVVNLPVRTYQKRGTIAQKMMKLMFQRTAEQALQKGAVRLPAFLWADEYQTLYYDYDREFQATARSSHISTVYLTQNLPNTYEAAGGAQIGENKSKALIGNLNTKFFLAQDDPATNTYAAELIGQEIQMRKSKGISVGENVSFSSNENEHMDFVVRPEAFHRLRNGGYKNNFLVDAYMVQTGRVFTLNNDIVLKTTFSQKS